jgi:D-alanyl-D-alanine carboxypeptidase
VTGIAERMLPPAEETGSTGRHTGRTLAIICAAAGLMLLALVVTQMVRPLPTARLRLVTPAAHTVPGALRLPWPSTGQAVIEVDGIGRMGGSGAATPTPTASVAKVMTAYVFLHDHPLASGQEGPTYRISPEEAARLPWRVAREETHVNVVANQPFTEREALEALMIVSANNIAHELARWDSGGDVPFVAKMNAMARSLGMTGTRYTDPSGFDATTVSTASDQVLLFRAAMRIPAFAEVVSKPTFTPRTGGETRSGGNTLLGSYGVVGGKTGFTSQAGANYVFAARYAGRLLVGAVMAQPNATSPAVAVAAAQPMIIAAENSLTRVTLAPRGTVLARMDDGYGHRIPLAAAVPVTATGWPGLTMRLQVSGTVPRHAPSGATFAWVTTGGDRTPLKLTRPLHAPGVFDKLARFA